MEVSSSVGSDPRYPSERKKVGGKSHMQVHAVTFYYIISECIFSVIDTMHHSSCNMTIINGYALAASNTDYTVSIYFQ